MAIEKIYVPDIGDYADVEVIEINVKKGERVEKEASLITLETDKATMEIPCPLAGTIDALSVSVGDRVSKGDLMVELDVGNTDDNPDATPEEQSAKPETPSDSAVEKPSAAVEPKAGAKKDAKSETKPDAPTQALTVNVPDIGDYSGVEVIEINVNVGDVIEKEQALITLETDKATMEIPSPEAGNVERILLKLGDKCSAGDGILVLQTASANNAESAEKPPVTPAQQAVSTPAQNTEAVNPDTEGKSHADKSHAGPSVRQFARELGIALSQLTGTGRKGRITREDLTRFVKAKMQGEGGGLGLLADPVVDFAKYGDIEVKPLSRIQKISGANLTRNWVKIPHITLFDDADITDIEAFRKAKKAQAEKQGIKLTPVAFIVKAVAAALHTHPLLNSSLSADGQSLVMKKYIHIGVAVDTPQGLVVPVIKHADQKSIFTIAQELMALSSKARSGQLSPNDMKGGTFTISSIGSLGTTALTPIVNMPEVAILGVSKAQMKPVYQDGSFVPRLMLPLSLSADHRVVDGAAGAKCLTLLVQLLQDMREVLL